jgi:hypothetical protein
MDLILALKGKFPSIRAMAKLFSPNFCLPLFTHMHAFIDFDIAF